MIYYKNADLKLRWVDKIDAHSFKEKLEYIDTHETTGKFTVDSYFEGLGGFVEGVTDLFNEKIKGSDFDIEIQWNYASTKLGNTPR